MRTVFSQAQETVDVDGIRINFAKWAQFRICLNDVHRHKAPDDSKYRQANAGELAYLEQQLRGVRLGPIMNLEERSHELQSKEALNRFDAVSLGG
jgi:hypothetical protein